MLSANKYRNAIYLQVYIRILARWKKSKYLLFIMKNILAIIILFIGVLFQGSLLAQSNIKQSLEIKSYSLPFEENFDAVTFPPTDWTTFRGTNGAGVSQDWKRDTDGYSGSAGCAFVRYENNGSVNEDWMVSPQIELGSNSFLYFYEKQEYNTNYYGNYSIRVSTNSQTNHTDFTTIISYDETDFSTTYSLREIDLSAYDGLNVYIAFVMTNDNGDDWFVDNIEVSGGTAGGKLLISEVAYPKNSTTGRFVELYNTGNISIDLTRYYLAFYRNTRRINLSGTIGPEEKFIYAPDATDFQNTYGFAANQADGGIDPSWFNGTDAVILLWQKDDGKYRRYDTYGVAKEDGSSEEWGYLDKHAVRKTHILEDRSKFRPNEWAISDAYADPYFDVTPGNHKQNYYWNGNINNQWDDYENWTVTDGISCIPDAAANVIVQSGTANSTDKANYRFPYFFNSLSLESGVNFTLASDNILTIIQDVSIESNGSINIKSDANGAATFIPEGSLSGNANVERYMADISGTTTNGIWHLFSSPLSNMLTSALMDQYLKYWDEPNSTWEYISATDVVLTPAKGYALLLLQDHGNTVNMSGSLNLGDITSPNLDFTSGSGWEGYNLVGNPYTATVNWDSITPYLASSIDQAIHYWDAASNQYVFYNNGNGTASRFIPSGQAFFIHTTADNQQFTFTQESRASDSSHLYYKSKEEKTYSSHITPPREYQNRLVISSSNTYDRADKTFLEFHQKASRDFDSEFDALKFYSNNDTIAELCLKYNSLEYSINVLPENLIEGSYDLNIRYGLNDSYILSFEGMETFDENQPILLYDKITQLYYDLKLNAHFEFYNETGNTENRFEIVFSKGNAIVEQTNENPYLVFSRQGKLNIKKTVAISSNEVFDYKVYTVDGKLIAAYRQKQEVSNQYFKISPSVYIVKITTERQQITRKIWLSK